MARLHCSLSIKSRDIHKTTQFQPESFNVLLTNGILDLFLKGNDPYID